jgi:hypothetical protein
VKRSGAAINQFGPVATPGDPVEGASEFGEEVLDRAARATTATVDAVKEHPMATLAIVAGVAFAIGALWKIGSARREQTIGSFLSRLVEIQDQLPRRWRT